MAPAVKLDAPVSSSPVSFTKFKSAILSDIALTPLPEKSAPQRSSSLPRTAPSGDIDVSELQALLQSFLPEVQNNDPDFNKIATDLLNSLLSIAPPSDPKDPMNDVFQAVESLVKELRDALANGSTPSTQPQNDHDTLISTANNLLKQLAASNDTPAATTPTTPVTPSVGPQPKGDAMDALVQLTIIMIALEIAINAFMAKNAENQVTIGKNEMFSMQVQLASIKGQIDEMEREKEEAEKMGWIMVAITIFIAVVTLPVDPVGSTLMLGMAGEQIAEMKGAIPQNWTGSAVGDLILKIGITIVLSLASCGTAAPEAAAAEGSSKAATAAAEAAEKVAQEATENVAKASAQVSEKSAAATAAAGTPAAEATEKALSEANANLEKAQATAAKMKNAAEKAKTASTKAAEAAEKVENVAKVGENAGKGSQEYKTAIKEAETALKDAKAAAKEAKVAAKDAGMDTKLAEDAEKAADKALPKTKKIPINFSRASTAFATLNPLNNAAQLAGDDKTKEILTIVFAVITAILAVLAAYKGGVEMENGLTSPGPSILSKLSPEMQETITQILMKITGLLNLANGGLGIGTGMINYKKGQIQEQMAAPSKNFAILTALSKMWNSQMKQTSDWQSNENNTFIEWNKDFANLSEGEAAAASVLKG
ncbi:MAG: hypothetical protein JSS32_09100 [Verrucomicrobia bacterium]|nr:hypothetical protein [Verrucomicrobiota bacterium]